MHLDTKNTILGVVLGAMLTSAGFLLKNYIDENRIEQKALEEIYSGLWALMYQSDDCYVSNVIINHIKNSDRIKEINEALEGEEIDMSERSDIITLMQYIEENINSSGICYIIKDENTNEFLSRIETSDASMYLERQDIELLHATTDEYEHYIPNDLKSDLKFIIGDAYNLEAKSKTLSSEDYDYEDEKLTFICEELLTDRDKLFDTIESYSERLCNKLSNSAKENICTKHRRTMSDCPIDFRSIISI